MKVHYKLPISAHKDWEGELKVNATVDGGEVDIDEVIYVDAWGNGSDVTYLLTEWAGLRIFNLLCDTALEESKRLDEILNKKHMGK